MMDTTTEVINALERAPNIIVPLVHEAPRAILKRRPSPRKWSIHEHACHLSVVHNLFFARLDQMLNDPHPVITPYDPGTHDPADALLGMDLNTSIERYVLDRRLLVDRVRTLKPADWRRTAEHAEYNQYSVFIMFRHLALHDFFHAYRIEDLLLKREWPAE
jgi:hypothetical protein